MFKILLINPHQIQQRISSTKEMLIAQQGKYSLGILSIATYIRNNSDFSVKLLDYSNSPFDEGEFMEMLKKYSPHVIGISTNSYNIDAVVYFLQLCKRNSSAFTVVGGFHLYLYPEETLAFPEVDYIVVGDGEVPFLKLCQHLSNSPPEALNIKGVYSKKDSGQKVFVPYLIENLDLLPPPDPDLLDNYKKIYLTPLTRLPLAVVVKSRGCPYNCSYCFSSIIDYRTLSVERLLEYVRFYLDKGIREIEFYDDTFNDNLQFINIFLDEIIKQKLAFNWAVRGIRLKKVSKELAVKMKKAGCTRVQVGIESGSGRVLQLMKRHINKEEMREAISCFHFARLQVVGNFIFGFPYETMDDINETIEFIFEVKPDFLAIHTFEFQPKTPLYRELIEKGLLKKDYYEEYFTHPVGPIPSIQLPQTIEKKKLVAIRARTIRRYYFRIAYCLQILKKIKPSQLRGSLRLGGVVFFKYL